MALIKCAECGKEMSNEAKSCPHCGCPNERKQSFKRQRNALIAIMIALTLIVVAIIVAKSAQEKELKEKVGEWLGMKGVRL